MLTKIEQVMFRECNVTHAVVGFALTQDKLLLTVAPWNDLAFLLSAEFPAFKITSLDVYPDEPIDLNLPWDIIGFNSDAIDSERWEFVLHCDSIEYSFESKWPVLIYNLC